MEANVLITEGERLTFEALYRTMLAHGGPTVDACHVLDRDPVTTGQRPWSLESIITLLRNPHYRAWRERFEEGCRLAGMVPKSELSDLRPVRRKRSGETRSVLRVRAAAAELLRGSAGLPRDITPASAQVPTSATKPEEGMVPLPPGLKDLL